MVPLSRIMKLAGGKAVVKILTGLGVINYMKPLGIMEIRFAGPFAFPKATP
jgi:hypothetical protein